MNSESALEPPCMTSNQQVPTSTWDGINQKTGETDSLLSTVHARTVATWQRLLALVLLVTAAAIIVALGAVVWQLTLQVNQLSRAIRMDTSTPPANELYTSSVTVKSLLHNLL